ncbi:MAG: hypothetical protein D6800_03340, partial [Candidatus Zixiibacteriota bacterium]
FKHGTGCTQCRNTGFKGLTGIYEFIVVTPEISEKIIEGASLRVIREIARRYGYVPLFEAGLEKLTAGTICLEELLKETSNIEEYFETRHQMNIEVPNVDPV